MKKSNRILFGLFSSILLGVGLVRAAERLDPLSPKPLGKDESDVAVVAGMAPDCSNACDAINPNR